MEQISFAEWNLAHDAGQEWSVGETELISRFPDRAEAILAYRRHFARTLTGLVPGTAALVAELQRRGVRLIALTNWSAELFPVARRSFSILDRFEGIVVSGEEQLAKPDPAIFTLLCERYGVDPAAAVFIDDSPKNCRAAAAVGLTVINFVDAESTRSALVDLGLLQTRQPVAGPVFHVAERELWQQGLDSGDYPWSSRGLSYQRQGFVHCALPDQVAGVLASTYADLNRADLVVGEFDPQELDGVVIMEDLGGEGEFPHLYAPLDLRRSRAVHPGTSF
nr:HAD-IA family hydrolase [Microlunatus panaciterrae]